jgi:hypothetical protein
MRHVQALPSESTCASDHCCGVPDPLVFLSNISSRFVKLVGLGMLKACTGTSSSNMLAAAGEVQMQLMLTGRVPSCSAVLCVLLTAGSDQL